MENVVGGNLYHATVSLGDSLGKICRSLCVERPAQSAVALCLVYSRVCRAVDDDIYAVGRHKPSDGFSVGDVELIHIGVEKSMLRIVLLN